MKITMVKKELANGQPCDKCMQAEQLLKDRGLWEKIDEVVWAVEGKPDSPGFVLADKHGIKIAPFFIVADDDGTETVYRSSLQFMRKVFPDAPKANQTPSPSGLPEWESLEKEYRTRHPQEIMEWGLSTFGEDCAIAFSGAEDVVLIDMAAKTGKPFSVFCLDTGRLHPETYQYLQKVRDHYNIKLQIMSPNAEALQAFVQEKGLYSFLEDGHKECCGVRKVEPLRRALSGYKAWISGQRKDQSPSTRSDLLVVHKDEAFSGVGDAPLTKMNPLADWSSTQVWQYIMEHKVPYNPLHQRGFRSIGCEPCTRPTLPGEHERAGRWWWEESTKRECGLHIASDT